MSNRNKKHWNDAPIESEQELYELFEAAVDDVLSSAALMISCDSFAHPFSKRLRITNNKRRLGSCELSKTICDGVIVDEKFEISISRILFHSYQQTESVNYSALKCRASRRFRSRFALQRGMSPTARRKQS